MAALCLSSCLKEMGDDVMPHIDRSIVIDFSSPDPDTKASVGSQSYESHVSHLDILIFKLDGTLFWHERTSVSASSGTHAMSVGTSYFTEKDASGRVVSHPRYNVHILANCPYGMAFSESEKMLAIDFGNGTSGTYRTSGEIGAVVMENRNIHLSGLNLPSAPTSFLMHSTSGSVYLSDDDKEKNIVIDAALKRAAAKVIINIMEGERVEFTEGDDTGEPEQFDESEGGLYYIRNLPYRTTMFPKDRPSSEKENLLTTVKTNNAHFTWNPATFLTDPTRLKGETGNRDVVTLTTYVYEHDWTNQGVFEYEPCAVVNLPMISLREQDGEVKYDVHANSWYKIPLTKGTCFERNYCYKVNVIINYAGATTVMEPVVVPDITYEVLNYKDSNLGWNTQTVTVSQSDRPKYLTISDTELELHNRSDSDDIRFTSSSDVSVTIDEVYYYDKFGVKKTVSAGNDIKVSATPGLTGKISIVSPVPTNNTTRYIKVRVSNGEVEDKYFLVSQYPLEYITNIQGYYSYRSDFGNTTYETYDNSRYVAVGGWSESGKNWRNYYASGGSNSTYFFTSKVAVQKSNGQSTISYYSWNKRGNKYNLTTTSVALNNGRMYNVKLTASSGEYSLGIPKLDSRGYTDSGSDNEKLVCPSFMIASQLGATYAPASVEQAANHCNKYVETYKDASGKVIHLDDWRLPTAAEINIIIKFQYMQNAAMDEVLSGRYYWSATGQVENPESDSDSNSSSAVRCIRNSF